MEPTTTAPQRLSFTWQEFSGSLGDLGLFIPLVVGMTVVGGLDLTAVLVAAGSMNIATGLLFRQPIPVQPMKAIAVVVIAEGMPPGAVMTAGLLMGAILLGLALTGTVERIYRLVPISLVRGVQLGVGLKLTLKGLHWIADLPILGWNSIVVALAIGGLLVACLVRRKPGALWIILGGFLLLYLSDPGAYAGVRLTRPTFDITWPAPGDWQTGFLHGVVPQLPLTLLNSVVAVCALSTRYFPTRGISPTRMAASIGLMNLCCAPFGAIPMCHGAGGLAAQYGFGARTGGSVVMLGAVKVVAGLAFGSALVGLLQSYPLAVLGPMLVIAGAELARSGADVSGRQHLAITLVTAAAVLGVNALIGFLAGAGLYGAYRLLGRAQDGSN
jgi:hypothetical protein